MDIGYEAADGVLRLRRMLKLEECGVIERLENIKNNSAWRIADLKINGNDLLAMGIKGERVGVILHSLLSAVVFEKCENEKSALIEMAEQLKGVENGV